eukprot:14081555-Heterocapsa_arctica.AAC.1
MVVASSVDAAAGAPSSRPGGSGRRVAVEGASSSASSARSMWAPPGRRSRDHALVFCCGGA